MVTLQLPINSIFPLSVVYGDIWVGVVCTYVFMHVCMHQCMYISVYVCIMYACICVCMHVPYIRI